MGSVDYPFNPITVALGASATFVARTIDVEQKHLGETLKRAHAHRGASFVEILQNCNIFNDGAFNDLSDKAIKADHQLVLEHGKPLIFGKNRDKGIRMNGQRAEVVTLGDGVTEKDLVRSADAGASRRVLRDLATDFRRCDECAVGRSQNQARGRRYRYAAQARRCLDRQLDDRII
jgi:hypothetical protein